MAENRAGKAGFAAEAKAKMDSKYDPVLACDLLQWISDLTGAEINTEDGSMDNSYNTLRDGVLLCNLINSIQEGLVPEKKINKTSKMAFKCMENIQLFLSAAASLGVPDHELFQTVDLWEMQNMSSVQMCLQSLARKASKYGKPSLGPKESEGNRRSFTDEQLKAGESVIGLQYGYNKGATQSGINFGNTRHM